jgi:predicted DNA-binding ribbon-helix-helix protein
MTRRRTRLDETPPSARLAATLAAVIEVNSVSERKPRTITISGRRTTMALDTTQWRALDVIAREENATVRQIISRFASVREGNACLTKIIQRAILIYFTGSAILPEEGAPILADNPRD